MTTTTAPHVVIVGGYLTEPVFYRPMRARLLARGAASVALTGLHLPDWLAMAFAGMGPAMLRTARTIREQHRERRAPLLVIGHSAGGILARLAMNPSPIDGRRGAVGGDVAALVTLGTPHRFYPRARWRHPGVRATELLERTCAGAFHAPRTSYLTVGSTYAPAAQEAPTVSLRHVVDRTAQLLIGQSKPGARGDGIVADELCRLEGVRHLALDDALHGTFGGPWFGDAQVIDQWWPAALEVWREALAARGLPNRRPR